MSNPANQQRPNQQQGQQKAAKPAVKRGSSWLGYAFNPNLGQSIKPLRDNFRFFRMTIAVLFAGSGMLDKTHSFFRPDAHFTLADLFRETYARVDWKDQSKMPQNIFFVAVWGLLTLSFLWVATLVLYFVAGAGTAHAADTASSSSQPLFGIIPGNQDIATQFIDNLIMGDEHPIVGVGTEGQAGYMPKGPVNGLIQAALRAMLEFYSSAVLAFASFLLLYHVINMVVQAAWSGKALEGAAQIWAPLRLVLAICLLVPMGSGLNAAQLMTLEIAKLGSGLATRAWNVFGQALTDGDNVKGVAMANLRGVEEPVKRLMVIYGCMADVNIQLGATASATDASSNGGLVIAGAMLGGLTGTIFGPAGVIAGYAAGSAAAMLFDDTIIEKENMDAPKNERLISVGSFRNPNLCGLTSIPGRIEASSAPAGGGVGDSVKNMRATIQNKIADLSMELRGSVKVGAACMAAMYRYAKDGDRYENAYTTLCNTAGVSTVNAASLKGQEETVRADIMAYIGAAVSKYYSDISAAVSSAADDLNEQNAIRENSSWIEAGVYFARVSAIQYAIVNSAQASLKASLGNIMGGDEATGVTGVPALRGATRRSEAESVGGERGGGAMPMPLFGLASSQESYFKEMLASHADFIYGTPVQGAGSLTATAAGGVTLNNVLASTNSPASAGAAGAVAPGNIIIDGLFGSDNTAILKMMTGPSALSDPINSLFNTGHMIYSSAIMLLFGGAALSVIAGFMGPIVGGVGGAIAQAGIVLAYMMLTVSFPVVFILPVLPLTRFLAGLMSWLLGLFEAIASMPLFALAHLNPKGSTLFEPAQRGYHYLLHIALKPILLVFGMIGVIIVLPIILYAHNALYSVVINMMWDDKFVSPVDKIMFFLAYAGTAYGFVNIAFKAIDDLSSKSLGWGNFQNYGFRDDSESVSANTAAFAQFATDFAGKTGGALGGINRSIKDGASRSGQQRIENMKLADQASKMKVSDGKGGETNMIDSKTGGLTSAGRASFSSQRSADAFEKRSKAGIRAISAPTTGGILSSAAVKNARSEIMANRANSVAASQKETREKEAAEAAQAKTSAIQQGMADNVDKIARAVAPGGGPGGSGPGGTPPGGGFSPDSPSTAATEERLGRVERRLDETDRRGDGGTKGE